MFKLFFLVLAIVAFWLAAFIVPLGRINAFNLGVACLITSLYAPI